MSELSSDLVHRGYWVNLSEGAFMGRTITTDTKTGVILVALLAVFTTLASNHLWNLFAFTLHQVRANGRISDGLYRQQQALLRTFPSAGTLLWESLKLLHVWKGTRHRGKHERRALRHSLGQAIVAVIFTTGFIAASVFSSQAISGTDIEVLVQSSYCGLIPPKSENSEADAYSNKVASFSTRYAEDCYLDNDKAPSRCNIFVHPHLPMNVMNESCPFGESVCATQAVSIDSGLLDLNDAFGLNLKKNDRMKLRTKMSCAVLSLENRTTLIKAADVPESVLGRPPLPEEEMLGYHLGTNPILKEVGNVAFMQSLAQANVTRIYDFHHYVWAPHQDTALDVIPELKLEAADVWLQVIKKNNVLYDIEVDDPLFAAHKEIDLMDASTEENTTVYISDAPASALGCTSQVQFCINNNATGEKCTALMAESDTVSVTDRELMPHASAVQQELINILSTYADNAGLVSLDFATLDANSKLNNGWVYTLPADQWTREVKRWGATSLAMLQTRFADYAIGPSVRDSQVSEAYRPPKSDAARRLCGVQKMRKAGGFVNINVFALSFIIAVACTATFLDLVLLRSLIYMSRFRAALSPRLERWIQDGVFQLQRHAYEGEGQGVWERTDKEIPITGETAQLSDLSVEVPQFAIMGRVKTFQTGCTEVSKPETKEENSSVQEVVSRPVSPVAE